MNEKIRELWDRAAESTAAYHSGQNNSWETQVDFMEKFAQLIVRECIDQLYYTREERMDDTICQAIKERIEKHFGVGE